MTTGSYPQGFALKCAGFTLLEILVVLVLMSLTYALAPPMFGSGLTTAELKGASRQLAAGLRKTRNLAIMTGKQAELTIDVNAKTFHHSGDKKIYRLPKTSELTVFTEESKVMAEKSGSISFYPDGSSAGGRITIASGKQKYLIDVHWLTGQVEILE